MVGGEPTDQERARVVADYLGAGNIGYDEGVLRPDLLIVEAGRTNMVNAKRRDREAALLGASLSFT
jgi:hypothetical protein